MGCIQSSWLKSKKSRFSALFNDNEKILTVEPFRVNNQADNRLKSNNYEGYFDLNQDQIALIENTWKLLVENISKVGVITFIN